MQYSFPTLRQLKFYGGESSKGKAKVRRPLVTKRPMFFTFKSSMAVGDWSFHRKENLRFIEQTLSFLASRFGIRIYEKSINGNHIHMLVQGRDRRGIQNFLRTLAAQIATFITKARRGKAVGQKFWDNLVHSQIVEGGRHFRNVTNYIIRNQLETWGFIPYSRRSKASRPPP